jgi:uncharacterized integral membrane protein
MAQPMPQNSTNNAPQPQNSKLGAGAISSLVGVGLLLVFILQNNQKIDLDFLFWTFTWPLWLLIIVSAVLGAIVWFGLGVVRRHRRRVARRADRRS